MPIDDDFINAPEQQTIKPLDRLGVNPFINRTRKTRKEKGPFPYLEPLKGVTQKPAPTNAPDIDTPDIKKPRMKLDDAYTQWNTNQTPLTLGEVLFAAEPLIKAAVTSYGGANPSPTLYSTAKIIVADAIKKYDPSMGIQLNTYLFNALKGLTRTSIKESTPVSIPERIIYDNNKMDIAGKEFQEIFDREPSIEELADATGLSTSRIEYVRKYMSGTVYEGNMQGEEGQPMSPGTNKQSLEDQALELVYFDLDVIDKLVFDYKMGMHGQKAISVTEIAKKLKMSPSSVSQRAAKISKIVMETQQMLLEVG
jgi:DNA-directed RNA polymerase specialized sigma subunit